MEYAFIPGIDKKVSRLVYGTPSAVSEGSPDEAYEALERAYSHGFRMFDTANAYGLAEENIGHWLKRSGHRNDIVIMDKGCNPGMDGSGDPFSAELIRSQVELSLKRFGTDFIDLYVLHRDDVTKPVDEIVDVLNELKKEGKIGKFGGSNWTMERLKETMAYAEKKGLEGFSVCSPCYGIAELKNDPWGGSVTISGKENEGFREWLAENQMPAIVYSPQARGFMSGKFKTWENKPIEDVLWWGTIKEYDAPDNRERLKRAEEMAKEKNTSVSAITLAWLHASSLNIFPIVGSSGDKHILEAISSFDLSLTKEERDYLLNG